MPAEGVTLSPADHLLTTAEIERLARLFAAYGVDKVRLTGGEPTIRRDLVEIVDALHSRVGISQIGITTNGIALARRLDSLVAAGLSGLNISLDTLNEAKFTLLTRRNGFRLVLRAIERAEPLFERLKVSFFFSHINLL